MDWQKDEMRMFLHFTVNTFTDREWGTGDEDPGIFDPSQLDARQWARVAKESGFKTVILTAKHHDGFTLWPSDLTDHSVESSPWRNGSGDVVRELADAANEEGLKLGLYLSPWDMHEPSYGDEEGYNQFYLGQLRELLTRYGTIAEVWFDGAKGEDAGDMSYAFDEYRSLVRQLQPGAVMFSDEGPDVRWIGNERGFAGQTNWSTLDPSKVEIGKPGQGEYLNQGEAGGPAWIPGECDVSIRPGWFWHPDQEPKSLDELLEIYFNSVGRNCVLLLNVPPDTLGRIPEKDVVRLREFKAVLDGIFSQDLAQGAEVETSSIWGNDPRRFGGVFVLDGNLDTYWAPHQGEISGSITLDLPGSTTFDVIRIQEPVTMGQRVARYRVEAWIAGSWQTVVEGTTIGYKKLDRLADPVTTSQVRLVIEDARAEPLIAEIGLHLQAHAKLPPTLGLRLTGPSVVGTRPGTPFLHPMGATGTEGSRTFYATNLPDGLQLDPTTGFISGTTPRAGTYDVTVGVRADNGEATRNLRIQSGDQLALTPPMAFNSWNIFQSSISAQVVREIADAMVNSGMRDAGYLYVNLDDQWALPERQRVWTGSEWQDRLVPDTIRFPDGMEPVAEYVHERGLKLGIYSDAAARTCSGSQPGSFEYERIDAQTFSEWGIDYLKYDYCGAPDDQATAVARYDTMGDALATSGRSVVYSICEWGQREPWTWGKDVGGHLWRTTFDTRFHWEFDPGVDRTGERLIGVLDALDLQVGLEDHQRPGAWNDPDMLMVGVDLSASAGHGGATGLSRDEEQAMFSMWALLSAPLIVNADIRRLDPLGAYYDPEWAARVGPVLTNHEVIAVDQDPSGAQAVRVADYGELEVWARPLANGDVALGLLNRGDRNAEISVTWDQLGISGTWAVRGPVEGGRDGCLGG